MRNYKATTIEFEPPLDEDEDISYLNYATKSRRSKKSTLTRRREASVNKIKCRNMTNCIAATKVAKTSLDEYEDTPKLYSFQMPLLEEEGENVTLTGRRKETAKSKTHRNLRK
ncbi:hypothetical protein AVEN_84488-1 [Araneus ventricosus]|uniref:Uncharacterized protein n=1 Tax=Araneus ventricosus TaxID=182803 RepID=A0A4Y2UF76_ARAVE|nr:hypothetical protein AVEN_84488-1 [Araneus ventricosus]